MDIFRPMVFHKLNLPMIFNMDLVVAVVIQVIIHLMIATKIMLTTVIKMIQIVIKIIQAR